MNATRAYWELRAEQVMDRVFDPAALELGGRPRPEPEDASIEVEVRPLPPTLPSRWLILGCGGLACLALALGIAWRQAQQDLRQERTVRLLEGLRSIPPTSATPAAAPRPAPVAPDPAAALPPPPPDQAWIQELARLEGPAPSGAAPLRVPLNGTLRAPAPRAAAAPVTAAAPSSVGMPELVGVVHVPGRAGSAIFQVGRTSYSVATGELIGSSGWRLQATSADSVLIQRGGQSRRVSIGSGL